MSSHKNKHPDNNEPDEFDVISQMLALQGLEANAPLTPRTAARLDLFIASKSVELASIPPDSLVVATTDAGIYNFHKPALAPGTDQEKATIWAMITPDEHGHPVETPVRMIGSATSESGVFAEPNGPNDSIHFRQGQYFIIGKIHEFAQGSDEGVPERFSLLPPASEMSPDIVDTNIRIGMMTRSETGDVMWRVVTEHVMPPIQEVQSISLQGTQAHL